MVGEKPTYGGNTLKQSLAYKNAAEDLKNQYIVLLEQEPVSLYQGGVKGLTATHVQASKHTNVTAKGQLDLNSSASIMYQNYLALEQNKTISGINQVLKRNVPVVKRHSVALNAVVMQLEEYEVAAVRKSPGVLAVQKNGLKQIQTDVGPVHVGAPEIWDAPEYEGVSKGEGLVIGILDTGIASYQKKFYTWRLPTDEQVATEFNPSFADIGGDGYDHTNPYGEGVYFGDCVDQPYLCNDKLVGVVSYDGGKADLFSSSDIRYNTGQDDHGHGTHVASTAAGNVVKDVPFQHSQVVGKDGALYWEIVETGFTTDVTGVAPHANIISYKTCTALNGCWDTFAIEAIEHAIANGVDVINYSVGGGASSPWYNADSLAFLSAREAGIHVAISAGNAGPGPQTVGAPGNSPWVTTVSALTHGRDFTEEKTIEFSGGDMVLDAMSGKGKTAAFPDMTEIVYAGDIESETYQENQGGPGYCYASKYGSGALPRWGEDAVTDKIVVCRRGGTYDGANLSRLNKSIAAEYAGAAGLVLINSDEEFDNVVGDLHALPTIHLNKADGDKLLEWLAAGEGHMASILGESEKINNEDKADIVANFSSRGPDLVTQDYLVPDVGGPGVDIYAGGLGNNMHPYQLGDLDKKNGNFVNMSGTSMSSPHLAGMMVLMKAAQPEWTPAEVQSALMMTAVPAYVRSYEMDENGDLVTDEEGNFIEIIEPATHHDSGSGSARVNLAIEAGLVLNETPEGYLAANPFANEFEQSEIEGWHGEPHQMNISSLTKSKCLMDCSWTRTFRATKAGSWTVSFEMVQEGFTLSADQTSFTVADNEEITVEFFAEVNQALASEWVNGQVVLTSDDANAPVLRMPVTINFIAGTAPEEVEINTGMNVDSAPVQDVVTIGTSDLQTVKSGIAKAEIYEATLRRDDTNSEILHSNAEMDDTVLAIPLNIQADTKRLVVEVLETTSPDIDIFVGIDTDLSGDPTGFGEMGYMVYMSATETSYEKIDEINPRHDTYWILVHNWAEGPAPLTEDQVLCEEGDEAPEGKECVFEAPIYDSVKLAVTNVKYDDDSMMIEAPTSAEPRAEVPVRVKWAKEDMREGDLHHGVFWLGTTAELNQNIGPVRVEIARGEDDIQVSDLDINGSMLASDIQVRANTTGEPREYTFAYDLAPGVIVESIVADVQSEESSVMSMLMSTPDVEYTVENNRLVWSHTQEDGASPVMFSVVLDASAVTGMADVTPVVTAGVNTSDMEQVSSNESGEPIFIEGRPVFSATASVASVKEGEMASISASVVDAVIANPEISYHWRQVSGPAASMNVNGSSTLEFVAPSVGSTQTLVFELVGSNGSKESSPVQVSVNVEDTSSGGSTSFLLLMLMTFGLIRRYK